LYGTSGSEWDPVIQAKEEHPDVPIVAIINNFGGPGSSADASYATLTQRLHSAGIVVLGYTYADYSSRDSTEIRADMDNYKNWYNIDGILIDEMSNFGGDESYYSDLTSYARSIGLTLVIGNPGTETLPSYIGTVDAIVIYEDSGYPSIQYLGGWHANYDKTTWGILPHGVDSLDKTFVARAVKHVGYIGIGSGNGPDAWGPPLPSYFGELVASLDTLQPPTGLTATAFYSSQINLSWSAPTNNGGSPVTSYEIKRSTDGSTWSVLVKNTGTTDTTYSDTGLSPNTTYYYRVFAINDVGTSHRSNTASATTSTTMPPSNSIVLNSIQSTSGTASNQITISNFNAGTGSNRLLVVGTSANNNNVTSVTFGGIPLTRAVSSFFNNDAEFWYLTNPSGTGDIITTMNGPTSVVVGAYSFSGVDQTNPIANTATNHNTSSSSPSISITTQNPNDLVLDLPSIWGGVTLGLPTCTQEWNTNIPSAITGASSSASISSPGSVTCGWTASSGDMWDDAAVEIKSSG
jgi:hypothetical protein